jgi:hypothetical protein
LKKKPLDAGESSTGLGKLVVNKHVAARETVVFTKDFP